MPTLSNWTDWEQVNTTSVAGSPWTVYVEATTASGTAKSLFFLKRDGSGWESSGGLFLRPDNGGWTA